MHLINFLNTPSENIAVINLLPTAQVGLKKKKKAFQHRKCGVAPSWSSLPRTGSRDPADAQQRAYQSAPRTSHLRLAPSPACEDPNCWLFQFGSSPCSWPGSLSRVVRSLASQPRLLQASPGGRSGPAPASPWRFPAVSSHSAELDCGRSLNRSITDCLDSTRVLVPAVQTTS